MTDVAALQLLVPDAETLVDAVRGLPHVGLLAPAHVSLGYPWRSAQHADADVVRQAAASTAAFDVCFQEVRAFAPDKRSRTVVHLVPDDVGPFRALAALVGADLRDVHLSLARVLSQGDVGEVLHRVEPRLPLVARITELELTRQRDGVWLPGERFTLGG